MTNIEERCKDCKYFSEAHYIGCYIFYRCNVKQQVETPILESTINYCDRENLKEQK